MIQINIKNIESQQITHGGQFPSMEEAQAWIDSIQSMSPCPWGQPSSVAQVEVSPAVLDEEGNVIQEAQYEEQAIAGSYEIEILDISARVEQERVNAEALKYLADTDWLIIRELDSGEACPADIKAERAAARARIVR